jgi:ParB/RepB/Spo0J family partition protein
MEPEALAELRESIRLYGLIQPISVTRTSGGRFIILAGHRRAEAYRQLLDAATTPAEKERWSRIPVTDRGPTATEQLAELALTENLFRDDLRPVETAEALADLKETRKLSTEQLAEHLGLEVTKTKRYLQLAGAPPAIRTALAKGIMVEVSDETTPNGKPRREHRTLELSHALLILRAYGHWQRARPKKAAELARALVERVLGEGWPQRKLKDHVDALLEGRAPAPEVAPSEAGEGTTPPAEPAPRKSSLYQADASRVVIHRAKLAEASKEDRDALAGLLSELLEQLR